MFTEPPILLERRSEPGGAVGFVKPVSPIRNSTLADPEALVFETLTLEEKRSACAGVPGELEAAPTRVRVRLFGVVTVLLQAPPDAAGQIGVKVAPPLIEYSASSPADADAGHRSGAVAKATATRNVLFMSLTHAAALAAPENAAVARDSSIPAIIDSDVLFIVVSPLQPSLGAPIALAAQRGSR